MYKLTIFKRGMITIFFFFLFLAAFGQGNNTVQSLIMYDRHPVDLSTGTPQISLPLYTMPTHSKNIALQFSLNYHPANISLYNKNMADAGNGWSFFKSGGVIYRDSFDVADEHLWTNSSYAGGYNIYEFNFLDKKGKFMIEKTGTTFRAVIIENKGELLEINVSVTNNAVQSFTVYDCNGYIYQFSIADSIDYYSIRNEKLNIRNAFHLSSIKSSNSKVLVSYQYVNQNYGTSNHHFLKSVTSEGIGKIEFELSIPPIPSADSRTQYSQMTVFDFLQNPLLKFTYDQYGGTLVKSTMDESYQETYKFKYRMPQLIIGDGSQGSSFDYWGYPKGGGCNFLAPGTAMDTNFAMTGVLQQIIYPTGGSVIYDFEANTYSSSENNYLGNGQAVFFTDPTIFENRYNFSAPHVGGKTFTASNSTPYSFTVFATGQYYFKVEGEPYYDPNFGIIIDPTVALKNSSGTVLSNITKGTNSQNGCLGKFVNLSPGVYSIALSGLSSLPTTVSISMLAQNPSINKYWYGGGIRIKRIGFFDATVPNEYYEMRRPPAIKPVREINYGYHIFGETDRSSGDLRGFYPGYENFNGYSLVRYGNVTVRDTESSGKTEYTFIAPMASTTWDDFKVGNILKTAVFNDQGVLLKETLFDYDEFDVIQPPSGGFIFLPNHDFNTGWITPANVSEKVYDGNHFSTLSKDMQYNGFTRQITRLGANTSIPGEDEFQRIYYNTANNLFSKNRSQVERIESYKNNTLISIKRIQYSNIWPGSFNSPFLPKLVEVSKGDGPFKVVMKAERYDSFGNIIAYENEQGVKVVNIWGYNSTLLVAQIKNASYNEVPQNLITAIKSASDLADETSLISALDALRTSAQLSNAFLTTMTYKPLVGISTKTDARGYRLSYYYDSIGRLSIVRDENGKILTEEQYHYRP